MSNQKVKVLIVDDSALIRALLKEVLESHPSIEVCGSAADPYEARDKIKQLQPDVLTLDIEMPKMNGIAFLKNLMRLRPMPVVMISTLTQEGAPATLEALELGAVDFVPKPKNEGASGLANYSKEICEKVVAASKANLSVFSPEFATAIVNSRVPKQEGKGQNGFICAIGASTGGTEAIKDVVSNLPENCPPIVVTQHIPEQFSASFAKRVNSVSAPNVCEAEQGQIIEAGSVYISPGNMHLRVKKAGQNYVCHLDNGELINRHRPAVEPLFDSVIQVAGNNSMGVLLTGMGADGAEALLRMRNAGAFTVAQDEATSVVWGMPGAAVNLDAAQKVLPIEKVAKEIVNRYFG